MAERGRLGTTCVRGGVVGCAWSSAAGLMLWDMLDDWEFGIVGRWGLFLACVAVAVTFAACRAADVRREQRAYELGLVLGRQLSELSDQAVEAGGRVVTPLQARR